MKKYFTISEFARLRNININSLRYYEKLGLLLPVYVDPETKYRYYSPEQLPQLDMILLCIDLGIPLKELYGFVDEKGRLQSRALLQEGKRAAQKRMEDIQRGLGRIEHALDYFDTISGYENRDGLYRRPINARMILTSDYQTDLQNIGKVEAEFTHLYEHALDKELSPVLPSGVLVDHLNGAVRYKQFFEVLGKEGSNEQILMLPAGEYLCLQLNLERGTDLMEVIGQNFPNKEASPIVISNMFLSKFSFKNVRAELQQLL